MSGAYGKTVGPVLRGEIDFEAVTLKAMLCTSAYVADVDADEFRADITGELVATGYPAGGITLTGIAVTPYTSFWVIQADDAAFGTLTGTGITQMVIYISTGSSATDRLLANMTFASESPAAEAFTYQFDPDYGFVGYQYA